MLHCRKEETPRGLIAGFLLWQLLGRSPSWGDGAGVRVPSSLHHQQQDKPRGEKWFEAKQCKLNCSIVWNSSSVSCLTRLRSVNSSKADADDATLIDPVEWRCLTRRGVQRASALARQLGRTTTHDARSVCCRIENRGWTAARARRGSRRHRNVAPGLTVRRLRIARHHASGRSESKGSLKSWRGSNDVRGRGLCQSRTGRSSHCHCKNDPEGSHNSLSEMCPHIVALIGSLGTRPFDPGDPRRARPRRPAK
jgi:hypothetical protein